MDPVKRSSTPVAFCSAKNCSVGISFVVAQQSAGHKLLNTVDRLINVAFVAPWLMSGVTLSGPFAPGREPLIQIKLI